MNIEANPVDELIKHFNNYFPLTVEEVTALSKFCKDHLIKRRAFLLRQGEVCRHFSFVVSGCCKMYAVDQAGKEHNLEFAAENNWITDLSSFYSEEPSRLNIEAIEPTRVLQIKHDDVIKLYTDYPKFDHNFRVIVEQRYIELQNRVLQNISSSAEERYEYFLKQYANLATRLPNSQIASYIGITPEFLSMIRKTNVKNKR